MVYFLFLAHGVDANCLISTRIWSTINQFNCLINSFLMSKLVHCQPPFTNHAKWLWDSQQMLLPKAILHQQQRKEILP